MNATPQSPPKTRIPAPTGILEVVALGVRVTVPLPDWLDTDDLVRLRATWSRSRAAGPDSDPSRVDQPVGDRSVTQVPFDRIRAHRSFASLANAIATEVTLAAIEARSGELLLLHAAGVAEPETGRTLALVGPSGRGKTTAATELARHWGYVTDETVAVEPTTLRVWPHPKPLSVKCPAADGAPRSPKDQRGPDDLGLVRAPQICSLARVVLLDRDPGHQGPPTITPVSLARAVGELTAETSYLSRWDAPLAMVAGALTATGGALRLRYAEATDLPPVLPALVATPAAATTWQSVPVAGESGSGSVGYVRRPVREAIRGDGEIVVLLPGSRTPEASGSGVRQAQGDTALDARTGERVVVLDGIGPTLWELTARARTAEDLIAAVVDRHGAPPSGSADGLVVEALESLVEHGILERGDQP